MPKERDGFTLIELLIVIVIIGILATMAIRTFWAARDRGVEASMQSDLRTMAAHQENYFEEHFQYAALPEDLSSFSASPGIDLDITYAGRDGWAATASSQGLPTRICGMLVGEAPEGSAGPISIRNRIECVTPPSS